jgi:mono/diheme cytochrome c family protein
MRFAAILHAIIAAAAIVPFCSRSAVAETVDFAREVLPILQQHCAKCHTNGRYEGAISFDTREALLETEVVGPGSRADSSLLDRLTVDDPEVRMPLNAPALSTAEIDTIRRWIDAGLPWQKGFSFKKDSFRAPLKPRRPELPITPSQEANPIDRILTAYWQQHNIEPPKPIDDATFYRRASLDLVGLLPTAEEVISFEADRTSSKRKRLVRKLLDNRTAYADHWLTFWNDLLRNDYAGTGYIDGGRKQITAWLYGALVENMRYDEFVRELVNPSKESDGFANGIVWRGQVNASQRPELQYAQNVGQVFLGVNLKCASCHDSFVDEWKLTDSYGLAAVFSREPLEIHRCDVPSGKTAEPFFLFGDLGRIDPTAPREQRLQALADIITSADNGRLSRTIVSRIWDRLTGRGLVFPVDALSNRPWNEDLLDYLAADLQDRGYDLKQTLELIVTSDVYGSESVAWDPTAPVDAYVFHGVAPKRMSAEQFVDAVWQIANIAPEFTEDDAIFGSRRKSKAKVDSAQPFVRASLVESTLLMRSLGRPEREHVVVSRPAEMTTLEAIEMSNGQPLSELIRQAAEQLLKDHPKWTAQDMQQYLFQAALARSPSANELAKLQKIADATELTSGIEDTLWCILMLPEFQIIR